MDNDIIIGIDLAKNVFQLHGARRDGTVLFRKKLTRPQLKKFMSAHEPCSVAMEACGTSHYWTRELSAIGHDVKLIPPIFVKPFVKRQKNDAADAEAITEAALWPNMSFVEPKFADTQAKTMMMRARNQLIEQRTATVNALRGHLAEFGLIAPVGLKNVDQLRMRIEETDDIPALAVEMADMQSFGKDRDFAAWLGLIPRQNSSGGKTRLGATTKMPPKRYPARVNYRGHELHRLCRATWKTLPPLASGQA
jgi:transposase